MTAAQAHLADDADGHGGDEVPAPFRQALAALAGARARPEVVRLEVVPAPRRLAPYAHALQATVAVEGEELADGRFVVLYDPHGQDSWRGTFRVVTLTRAELEPEMAADPLLPEVTWSWLTCALEARAAVYTEPSGTVTRAASHYFGGLAERPSQSRIEIRASWTPTVAVRAGAPATSGPAAEVPDIAAHLVAWCDLLCQCAGLPPESGADTGASPGDGLPPGEDRTTGRIVPLPQRRGPRQH